MRFQLLTIRSKHSFLAIFLLFSGIALAFEKEVKDTLTFKEEINAYIQHHIKDSHDFSLFSFKKKDGQKVYVSIPLPVIIWDKDLGLVSFWSSKFKHGEAIVSVRGKYYKQYHSKIYETDSQGTIHYDDSHKVTNTKLLDLSITKSVVSILIACLLMVWFFRKIALSYQKNGLIPKGLGRFLEPIIIYIRDEIAIFSIGEKHYRKFMGYLLTLFFFILLLNLMGLTPLGINASGNIAITFCLAMITFFITQFKGNKNYWLHIFWMPGVPTWIKPMLMPIEVLGIFIKPFALMIRLYANMAAGHIVLMTLISLIFIFDNVVGKGMGFLLAFVIFFVKIMVAVLQAYIFTVLSALYFGFAVTDADH